MARRTPQKRPRTGQGGPRADWQHPDLPNEFSGPSRSSPVSRDRPSHDYQNSRRGSGISELDHHDASPRGRQSRLGLHRQDRGFVPGSRYPPNSGRLSSFDRLGFGQEPETQRFVDFDDHVQASHPIVHRHAPLGMPRRLGSGPDAHFSATCGSSTSANRDYRDTAHGGGHRPRSHQSLSPRAHASGSHGQNSHGTMNHNHGPRHRRRSSKDMRAYSPSNPRSTWQPAERYSPTMPEWQPSPGKYSNSFESSSYNDRNSRGRRQFDTLSSTGSCSPHYPTLSDDEYHPRPTYRHRD